MTQYCPSLRTIILGVKDAEEESANRWGLQWTSNHELAAFYDEAPGSGGPDIMDGSGEIYSFREQLLEYWETQCRAPRIHFHDSELRREA